MVDEKENDRKEIGLENKVFGGIDTVIAVGGMAATAYVASFGDLFVIPIGLATLSEIGRAYSNFIGYPY